jgi:hypothetical protein
MAGLTHNLARRRSFIRTAENQHGHARLTGEPSCQLGKMLAGPALGRAKRAACIETDDSLPAKQTERREGLIGRSFVIAGRGELCPDRVDRTAETARQLEIRFHDRSRKTPSRRIKRKMQPVSQ